MLKLRAHSADRKPHTLPQATRAGSTHWFQWMRRHFDIQSCGQKVCAIDWDTRRSSIGVHGQLKSIYRRFQLKSSDRYIARVAICLSEQGLHFEKQLSPLDSMLRFLHGSCMLTSLDYALGTTTNNSKFYSKKTSRASSCQTSKIQVCKQAHQFFG